MADTEPVSTINLSSMIASLMGTKTASSTTSAPTSVSIPIVVVPSLGLPPLVAPSLSTAAPVSIISTEASIRSTIDLSSTSVSGTTTNMPFEAIATSNVEAVTQPAAITVISSVITSTPVMISTVTPQASSGTTVLTTSTDVGVPTEVAPQPVATPTVSSAVNLSLTLIPTVLPTFADALACQA